MHSHAELVYYSQARCPTTDKQPKAQEYLCARSFYLCRVVIRPPNAGESGASADVVTHYACTPYAGRPNQREAPGGE